MTSSASCMLVCVLIQRWLPYNGRRVMHVRSGTGRVCNVSWHVGGCRFSFAAFPCLFFEILLWCVLAFVHTASVRISQGDRQAVHEKHQTVDGKDNPEGLDADRPQQCRSVAEEVRSLELQMMQPCVQKCVSTVTLLTVRMASPWVTKSCGYQKSLHSRLVATVARMCGRSRGRKLKCQRFCAIIEFHTWRYCIGCSGGRRQHCCKGVRLCLEFF